MRTLLGLDNSCIFSERLPGACFGLNPQGLAACDEVGWPDKCLMLECAASLTTMSKA